MTAETLQAAIDRLPVDHAPAPYQVILTTKKGKLLRVLYVRASSEDRARLTGIKTARYVFSDRGICGASVRPYPDKGIIDYANKRAGWDKRTHGQKTSNAN